jgi:O-antigen/teichoic acid export membrane protein
MRSPGRHAARVPGPERRAAVRSGRHAALEPRDRSELFANTIAAWSWSQGTLVVSVISLPLLTRWLSGAEFGLWTQLLSLSALATVADMGMSLVFLRRITDNAGADKASTLQSATVFYRASSAALAAVLAAACLVPGGLLSPYMTRTRMPVLAALLVIAAVGVNLRCQTATLRLLARGRVDLERIFGAGPAIAGTIVSTLAAYWFATAVAVAVGYAGVEIAFDIGLMIIAGWHWPRSRGAPGAVQPLAWWGRLWYESTGVLVIDLVPLLSLTIGISVVGHVLGPSAAAVYGLAAKVGSLVRRCFTPFTDSMFVSLCRAAGPARDSVARLASQLSAMTLAGGTAAACIVVTAGPAGMRMVFGGGYSGGAWVVLVFVLTETIRGMYRPFFRNIQSENRVGSLRYWFISSMIVQVFASARAATRWSTVGAAAAALACAALFEAAPVADRLSAYLRSREPGGKPALRQASAVCAGCLVGLLAWGRHRLGAPAVGLAAIGALAAGLLTLHLMARYLAAARPMTSSSLATEPVSPVPGTGQEA